MPPEKKKTSIYTILNRWLHDGSLSTQIPVEVVKDKSIGQTYLLYYFQSSSHGMVISKLFNNYGLFQMDRVEVFKFLKQSIMLSGYKPPFVKNTPKRKSKLLDILKQKHPFMKRDEIFMLINIIDNSDEKDRIYEMFGLYDPKKKKVTKAQQKKILKELGEKKEEVSVSNLMENFS